MLISVMPFPEKSEKECSLRTDDFFKTQIESIELIWLR